MEHEKHTKYISVCTQGQLTQEVAHRCKFCDAHTYQIKASILRSRPLVLGAIAAAMTIVLIALRLLTQ